MSKIQNLLKRLSLLIAAVPFAFASTTANAQSEIAHWSFNNMYTISNGVGTPNATKVTSNGSVNLHGVKLVANSFVGTGEYYLTCVRGTKGENVGAQDDKGAYHEVNAINCDGAALHMTSPVPTPETASNTYMWGDKAFTFPDGNNYSYQNPYNYFEMEVSTLKYKDIKVKINAAGHNSSTLYYAVAYSTDKTNWTVVGDEYLTGASYNRWVVSEVELPIANVDKAYIRIFPADNWKAGNSVSQDNQFDLDDVYLIGTLDAKRAEITSIAIDGQTVTAGTSYDYECNLPVGNTATSTTVKVASANGTVTATAKAKSGATVSVTDNGDGTFTLPTPEANSYTVVTFNVAANSDAVAEKASYTLYIFQKGDISLSALTLDGTAVDASVLTAINTGSAYTATISGNIYTVMPVVTATVIDGSTPAITSTVANNVATYTIKAGDRTFTLNVEGLHIYTMTDKDEVITINYLAEGRNAAQTEWTDGMFTLKSNKIDGWAGKQFKFNSENSTLELPGGYIVKQFTLKEFSANYGNGDGLTSLSSADGKATVWIPTKHNFIRGKKYNAVVTVENHTAGDAINFTLGTISKQPYASIELVVEKTDPKTAPRLMKTDAVISYNHATVTMTFDREMASTTATIDGKSVTADSNVALDFSITDLEYNKAYTLTVPAGAAKDLFGNSNTEALTYEFVIAEKPVATKAPFDYVVSTPEEFTAAFTALKSTNSAATAERKTILVLDGDYNFGAAEQRLHAYNVSIVGQSRDGVVIRGTRNGISNPVLNLRDKSGFYLQDLTLQNDFNWRMENKNTGQAVAVYGGNKTIMKNVRMHGNQDTQVTGERAYFDKCEIHGTVDFICGGGDNFYDKCDLIIEDRDGNVIAAPNSVPTLKWGYVFSGCTISPVEGAKYAVDGSYNLGRPWQNEPRIAYINTKMNILPDNNGWTSMGTLPTHFYEYGSVDKNGKAIDLSVRGNSPTSTNKYTPVLTKEQADKYTVYNVMTSKTDGWLPTDHTVLTAAPANVKVSEDGCITWDNDDQVRAYVIFKDGKYFKNTADNMCWADGAGKYTIRSANNMGGLSTEVAEIVVTETTGIEDITTDADVKGGDNNWYNLNGQRVDTPKRGVYIRNGKKIVVK